MSVRFISFDTSIGVALLPPTISTIPIHSPSPTEPLAVKTAPQQKHI